MKNNFKKLLTLTSVLLVSTSFVYSALPNVARAGETIFQNFITEIFNPIFQAGMVITVIYFLYGVMKYILNLDNLEARATAQRHMLWGLVGVFIVFSIGGIIETLSGLFGGMFS